MSALILISTARSLIRACQDDSVLHMVLATVLEYEGETVKG